MRLLIVFALLAPAAAIAKEPASPAGKGCVPGNRVAVADPSRPVRARPLGSEPPAAQVLALYRKVDGCPTPIVLRKGLGMNPDRQQPITGEAEPSHLRP